MGTEPEEPTQPTSKMLAVIVRLLSRIEDAIKGITIPSPPTIPTPPEVGAPIVTVNLEEKAITTDGVHIYDDAIAADSPKELWAPESSMCAQVKSLEISVDAAAKVQLFWGTTQMAGYYLPANGTVVKNFVGCNEKGPKGTKLMVKSSAACNLVAKATGIEVPP